MALMCHPLPPPPPPPLYCVGVIQETLLRMGIARGHDTHNTSNMLIQQGRTLRFDVLSSSGKRGLAGQTVSPTALQHLAQGCQPCREVHSIREQVLLVLAAQPCTALDPLLGVAPARNNALSDGYANPHTCSGTDESRERIVECSAHCSFRSRYLFVYWINIQVQVKYDYSP